MFPQANMKIFQMDSSLFVILHFTRMPSKDGCSSQIYDLLEGENQEGTRKKWNLQQWEDLLLLDLKVLLRANTGTLRKHEDH